MKTWRFTISILALVAPAAVLGAACASPDTLENEGDAEAGDPFGSDPEALNGRPRQGEFGGGGRGCAVLEDGAYCGGVLVPGDPNTLYRCLGGYQSAIQYCYRGCITMPPGVPDRCA
ncbi:hypothetical protein ACMHYB_13615 [Sorangium sp. So ce1128]